MKMMTEMLSCRGSARALCESKYVSKEREAITPLAQNAENLYTIT
jgi:hypothetical protein